MSSSCLGAVTLVQSRETSFDAYVNPALVCRSIHIDKTQRKLFLENALFKGANKVI